jgi:2-polyprenyl-3-methyl-5-hydroxy-6-metoxy-1,4-benzoquinol methylase
MIKSHNFFEQIIQITRHKRRVPFFKGLITNKRTLHIGCADWPIFNSSNNLHIELLTENPLIEGYDVDHATIQQMRTHPLLENAVLHTELPSTCYDILLIPETIEHVDNVGIFLMSLLSLVNASSRILITAPNAFCEGHIGAVYSPTPDTVLETVHPDHNCWYSVYTLPNVIRKIYNRNHIPVTLHEIGVLENDSMVYVLFSIDPTIEARTE